MNVNLPGVLFTSFLVVLRRLVWYDIINELSYGCQAFYPFKGAFKRINNLYTLGFMDSDWKVLNIFFEDKLTDEEISKVKDLCKRLQQEGGLEDFYYNEYTTNESHLRVGLKNATQQAENTLRAMLSVLQRSGRVTRIESVAPDLTDVDGVVMDNIKCVSRELSDIIANRFGRIPTVTQSAYLIHLMMNQLGYPYERELSLYSDLDYSARIALGNLSFGKDQYQKIESIIPKIGELAVEFNSRYPSQGMFKTLEDLSGRLGTELDKLFPRSDPKSGRMQNKTVENHMWALNLIVTNWEGWLHKSKSIKHYGQANPFEEALLDYLIWTSKMLAFSSGKKRAGKDSAS